MLKIDFRAPEDAVITVIKLKKEKTPLNSTEGFTLIKTPDLDLDFLKDIFPQAT